jgi:putative transposase
VSKRVSPTDRLRAEVDELFGSGRDLTSILEDVARLSVRLLLQTALEAEVDAFLGRARYQRRDGWPPPRSVKTTMGAVELQRPKLPGTDQAFCSRLFGAGVTRTNALESLVISGWVRGLSDRDIEATLAEVLGPQAALSKATASRICQRIGEEFSAWRARDLSGVRLEDLFLDASHFKMHPGAPAEPVLAAWGITTDGKPVLVGLGPAASESTDAGDDFLSDLVGRGLGAPLLGISDGAAGLTGPFPRSRRQPWLVHRARNVLAKVSSHDHDEVRGDDWAIVDVGDAQPGDDAVGVARAKAEAFATKWRSRYPSAVACVTSDLASLTVHLRSPAEHWHRIVTPTSSSGPSARLIDGPR